MATAPVIRRDGALVEPRRAYRPEEVGELLGLSRSTVFRLLASGDLGSIKVGASRRVTVEQLDAYLAAQ